MRLQFVGAMSGGQSLDQVLFRSITEVEATVALSLVTLPGRAA